jgi:DNA-directed RNA polymerase subunit RPC12/RpoP
MEAGEVGKRHAMEDPRDRCPECEHKLHPQEMEALFRGRKLDCWHCGSRLKAQAKGGLSFIAQSVIGLIPVVQTFVDPGSSDWWGYAFAGLVITAIHVLPPGLVHGAPWVRIVEH